MFLPLHTDFSLPHYRSSCKACCRVVVLRMNYPKCCIQTLKCNILNEISCFWIFKVLNVCWCSTTTRTIGTQIQLRTFGVGLDLKGKLRGPGSVSTANKIKHWLIGPENINLLKTDWKAGVDIWHRLDEVMISRCIVKDREAGSMWSHTTQEPRVQGKLNEKSGYVARSESRMRKGKDPRNVPQDCMLSNSLIHQIINWEGYLWTLTERIQQSPQTAGRMVIRHGWKKWETWKEWILIDCW